MYNLNYKQILKIKLILNQKNNIVSNMMNIYE